MRILIPVVSLVLSSSGSAAALALPQGSPPTQGAGGFTSTLASIGNFLRGDSGPDPSNVFGIGVPFGGLGGSGSGNSSFVNGIKSLASHALLGDKSIVQLVGGDGDLNTIICNTFKSSSPLGWALRYGFGGPTQGASPGETCQSDSASGGSGPYKAHGIGDASLPDHTIYVPKTPPADGIKMPVIVWANGACLNVGNMFANFLTEIASHGFMIIANGPADGAFNGMTTPDNLRQAIEWVTTRTNETAKYGNVDVSSLATSGQSCGGLEALSAAWKDARVKNIVLWNSGVIDASKRRYLADIKVPAAYFIGGPTDIAYKNAQDDYAFLNSTPVLQSNVDVGHLGSYYVQGGGKMGKAAVAYYSWKLRGDEADVAKYKPYFCDAMADSPLVQLGFRIESKGAIC